MWNLKPHQQTFPTYVILKSRLCILHTLNGSFTKNDFVSSCTAHLENTGSLIYADLPIVHPFHWAVCKKKNTPKDIPFATITHLIRKV